MIKRACRLRSHASRPRADSWQDSAPCLAEAMLRCLRRCLPALEPRLLLLAMASVEKKPVLVPLPLKRSCFVHAAGRCCPPLPAATERPAGLCAVGPAALLHPCGDMALGPSEVTLGADSPSKGLCPLSFLYPSAVQQHLPELPLGQTVLVGGDEDAGSGMQVERVCFCPSESPQTVLAEQSIPHSGKWRGEQAVVLLLVLLPQCLQRAGWARGCPRADR